MRLIARKRPYKEGSADGGFISRGLGTVVTLNGDLLDERRKYNHLRCKYNEMDRNL